MHSWLSQLILLFPVRRFKFKAAQSEPDTGVGGEPQETLEHSAAVDYEPLQPSQLDTDQLATDLNNCITSMQHECKRVEGDFLDIGESLQIIYGQATQLTQNAQSSVEEIGLDNEDNVLSKVTRAARQALTHLDQEQARIQESLDRVRSIGDQLLKLHHMIGGLKGIAKMLKMVAININIESSRSSQSQESFLVLAQEIRSLSDSVADMARILSKETKDVAANLDAMRQAMKGKLEDFQIVKWDILYSLSQVKS